MCHDIQADAHLKKIGNQLVALLQQRILQRSPSNTMGAFAGATAMAIAVAGFLPIGDGPNTKSDEEIAAAISRVERVLAIIAECEG
jgi:hypothetical protein